jgi:carboxyl-terminal processing protease
MAAAGAVALALAGCGALAPNTFQSETYSENTAKRVFEDAYDHIQERYIEPVAIAPLALNGMRGLLATQEGPGLRLNDQAETIAVMTHGNTLAQFQRPGTHDAEGWAEVTAGVVQSASTAEPKMAALSAEEIYQTVLNGVVELLDPFSRYASARDAEQQRAAREGFDGIGISIRTENGETHVIKVMLGTPAAASGLLTGDLITHVDGQPLAGLEPNDVVERLRGPVGSEVVLGVLRGDPPRPVQVQLRRAHVVPATVEARMDGNLAIFRISSFNRTTSDDLEQEYARLAQKPIHGIIIDLRGNPGGLLDQAVLAADLFLDRGIVISTFGRHPAASSIFTADARQIAEGVPMVLLINGRSASAAELMAAALQDRGRATVIGTTTHGKGSVQNLARLPNGGELLITWSRMHAPSGYILDRLGVLPSICTANPAALESTAAVSASLDNYAVSAARWHRYDHVDPPLAEALRTACPASMEQPDSDIALAKRLLHDPTLYQQAVRPVLESAAAHALTGRGTS